MNTVGIISDKDFEILNEPPYPHPYFESFENPLRIKCIMDYFKKEKLFEENRVKKIPINKFDDSIIELVHSKYHIDSIKFFSKMGSGNIGETVYITKDTFNLSKKAIEGTITALSSVISGDINQSFAFIRPPGHHALRDIASGLCIFNNIAIGIQYLRNIRKIANKIAIIDIDNHYGDGLAKIFYEDQDVLYFSVHEYDFEQGELGSIYELGNNKGLGYNINFPIPCNTTDDYYLEFFDIMEPIFTKFNPELIIVACGFDCHYTDPIGNCLLTANSYIKFTQKLLKLANKICNGKISFILEGGYSLSALPICSFSIIKELLGEQVDLPIQEKIKFPENLEISKTIRQTKTELMDLLRNFWTNI
jgi:acetoin utilization deacetylase AcuC-like enzyme